MQRARYLTLAVLFAFAVPSYASTDPAGAGCSVNASKAATLEETMAKAAASQKLVLVKIGTEWCSACKAFGEAVETRGDFRSSIDQQAVLFEVDGEKGDGKTLATKHHVYGFPTFLLMNAKGDVLDRWIGYKDPAEFGTTLNDAVAGAVTLDERLARFQKSPTVADAKKIANLRQLDGLYAEAAAYYRRAQALDTGAETPYEVMILGAMAGGMKSQVFGVPEMRTQADRALAAAGNGEQDLLKVAFIMSKVSMMAKDNTVFLPYLEAAVEGTASSTDPMIVESRAKLLPDYALFISKDAERAVVYKRATLPADWNEQPLMLNNFAWWCFENRINLKEAEVMARRGVELSDPGPDRANILDTLAEICNETGNCGDAVALIRQAVEEAPDNPYFKQQLDRFETLLASHE
jgi:thioredoxin-related protein